MPEYRIGEAAEMLGLSVDTLRYYERSGVVPPVSRGVSGARSYTDEDISRLRFVRRAQRMRFALDEIRQLLQLRESPRGTCEQVRSLAAMKLVEIERNLAELQVLRDELTLLIEECRGAAQGCPILERIDEGRHTRHA